MKNLYNKLAKYYDKFYSWKDYKSEADKIRDLVKKYKRSAGRDLLDVACGTGNHIQYLKKHFNITGIDINPYMLNIARRKYSDIKFILDDMRTFKLKERFDVIVCLFSSIAHLRTYSNLEKTIRNFATHLKPGGVVIVEPFVSPELFIDRYLDVYVSNEPGMKLVRMSISSRRGNTAIYDFHYLIGENGKVRHFLDVMELGMFESSKVLQIFKKAGLKADYFRKRKVYRGVYVAVKP